MIMEIAFPWDASKESELSGVLIVVAVSKSLGNLLEEVKAIQVRLSLSPVYMHLQRRSLVLSVRTVKKSCLRFLWLSHVMLKARCSLKTA